MEKLRITVLYGNTRRGSTYNCVQIFKEALLNRCDAQFTEFMLPRDMPHICRGCFNCFERGEDACPHADAVRPIVSAILESDGVILSSPVYALDASGAMKCLLDHMCYLWITHRPSEAMFNKVVMVIATAAGAGAKSCVKTLKKNARYWGVKRAYGYGARVAANSWERVTAKTKRTITSALTRRADRFCRAVKRGYKLKHGVFAHFMFALMGKAIGGYKPGDTLYKDTEYWRERGWLDGRSPFKTRRARQ